MTLAVLLRSVDKGRVLDALAELYPAQSREAHSEAWDEIMTLSPNSAETMIICVTHVYQEWAHQAEPDDYISVDGEDPEAEECKDTGRKGREITWAIEHAPWSEWLGMEVEVKTNDPRCDTAEKVAAHILWEMTICRYTQKEVAEQNAEIRDRIGETEKCIEEGALEQHCRRQRTPH